MHLCPRSVIAAQHSTPDYLVRSQVLVMGIVQLQKSSHPRDYRSCLVGLTDGKSVHPLMKDTNNRDTVIRDAKVNHVPLNIAASVPLTNMVARWSRLRRLGQHLEHRRQQVGVPFALSKSPLSARTSKCLPGRVRRRARADTQPCAQRSFRLKALASKRLGFPLSSPSISAARTASISAPRSCSRRMRSRMYSLSVV
jgi:hypothetical protein